MKKVVFIVIFAAIFQLVNAQNCGNGRYKNLVFNNVTIDSVTYSTPYGLKMDIYQPAGDTLSARPVIILAHGGSFTTGTRNNDLTIDSLCMNFARRGYVTASIDYRLASVLNMIDSVQALTEIFNAISDGKAAVRYFYKDARTLNSYKIDTNNVFIGGNSVGALLFMHYAYIDSLAECPSDIQTFINSTGGLAGNSGNAGYSNNFKAVINLAGGLNVPGFIGPGSKPVVSAQGDADAVIPYDCGYPLNGLMPVRMCGLGSLESFITANTTGSVSMIFPGDGHIPWANNAAKFTRVDTVVRDFLLVSNVG